MKSSALFALIGAFATFVSCGGADSRTGDDGTSGGVTGSGGAPASGGVGSGGLAGSLGGAGSSGNAGDTTASSGGRVTPFEDAGTTDMDAGVRRPDSGVSATDAAATAPDGAASASYVCSLILGIATTSEWFGGFEKVVDDARWELKFQDSAHIEKWADPANAVWQLPITSPCAKNADAPDRVVFMGTNYDYDTVELFLPKYIAVLDNVKAKYPTVEHMDVMTYTRGPGNKECVGANRSNDSYIKPAQDDAIAMFAAMKPGFVVAAPKWEVLSCSDFGLCPHLTGPANALISKTIGMYFLEH
jgi:hypothetical protein